ncbi:speckle-type POZ protein A [Trichonephila clavata]|uniref:Speckle-type POZ protein A n=1 Tax=Trichonephila clavata TaxID=2740835 RepID=A0A8X6KBV7_TRICU|nr:speckle-type POZ protein A [Trichonephila clavata]
MALNAERAMFKFIWRIENFSYSTQKEGEALSSSTFTVDTTLKTEWRLELYPRGKSDRNFISCFLKRVEFDDGPASVIVSFDISILDSSDSPHNSLQVNNETVGNGKCVGFSRFARVNHILKYKKDAWLPNNILTICLSMWDINLAQSVKCEARTRFGIEKRSFTWSIEKFDKSEPDKQWSIAVPSASNQPFCLRMTFSANGESECEGKIRIGIQNYVDWTIFLTCKIFVIDAEGNSGILTEAEHLFGGKKTWILPSFTTKGKLLARRSRLLPDGNLSLYCEITLSEGIKLNCIESSSYGTSSFQNENLNITGVFSTEEEGTLRDHLYCLYIEEKLCDLTLKVGNVPFTVHKAILSARSPVFSAMLNVRDGIPSSEIEIPDINADTMRKMLVFIYSDTLEELDWESALNLYSAADTFKIFTLKKTCYQLYKIDSFRLQMLKMS